MLWGSRFDKKLSKTAMRFSSSLSFDIRLTEWDIKVSKAHSNMLSKIKILSDEENRKIQNGLDLILINYLNGNWSPDKSKYEDIHSAIEEELTNLIGETGKKLHTARSRNDQVITDVRLWVKKATDTLSINISTLQKNILSLAEKHTETVIPGYTHLQRAQPISFAFHLLAYVEMFERDKVRMKNTFTEADECPLGSGALAGSTIGLDREMTAKELGFSKVSKNSLDSVSNRDFILEFLHSCNLSMMHLSRFCEELINWCSLEWNFIKIGDHFTTGSSLMPQKQNPDIPELIRGKTGRIYGNYTALLTVMKSLPLSYNRDLQEDKEGMFDSFDTLNDSILIISELINNIEVNRGRFLKELEGSFIFSTDMADYLVKKGIPFRESHSILGEIIKYAAERNMKLDEIELEEYKKICDLFENDIFDYLSTDRCLHNKQTLGSPNPRIVEVAIREWEKILA